MAVVQDSFRFNAEIENQDYVLVLTTSLLACVVLKLVDVERMCESVDCQVDSKGTKTDAEAGKDVSCKEAVREDAVFPPCLALRPRITVELWHLGRACM